MKFYKVIGVDRKNKDHYRLCYTDNKKQCKQYYIENGWKARDLLFIEIGKSE